MTDFYAFAPDPARARALDRRMQQGLADSLRHIHERTAATEAFERRFLDQPVALLTDGEALPPALAEAGIEPSVGSIGDSYDNALAETINGLYKTEAIHRCGPWRSFEAVEMATLEWVDWFNNRRLLEPIGNIPPAEAAATSP